MSKIGTTGAAAATAYQFNLNYVPQFLFFVAANAPSVRASVLGDGVITDLDATGCLFVQGLRLNGRVTNGYMIPMANGLITNKNLEIIYTTGGAVAIDLYAISMQKGDAYIQCLKQTIIASSGAEIKKFAALGLGNAAAGDIININYADGLSQKVELAELKATLALYCNDVNNVQGIDNIDAEISSVMFTPVATQIVHIVKYALPSAVNQNTI
jgi:hypothetical protein